MKDEKDKTKKNYYYTYIGKEMKELIDYVSKRFEEEYNFKPSSIKITNLIAERVRENKLF